VGSKAFYINRSDFFVFDVTKVPVGSSIDGTHLFNVTETGFYGWVTSYYSLKNKTWVSNWGIERLSPLSPGNWYERHAFVKVLDDEVKGKTWVALTLFFWDGAMWIGQDEIMLFPVVIV
jgi:hypothetical protein